jgi:hypothetical protein
MREVAPFEVVFFNEPNLPVAIPFLQLLFATDGVFRILIGFDVNKPMNCILLNKLGA